MTALYIGAREPVVDPRTGVCTPIWYRFFSSMFSTSGDGAVSDADAPEIAPSLASLLASVGGSSHSDSDVAPASQQYISVVDDLSPNAQQYFITLDDVLPVISSLRDEIAGLRSQIDDIRKAGVVL